MIPLIINAITANNATNWITCHIRLAITFIHKLLFKLTGLGFEISESTQPGNQTQFTSGAAANTQALNANIE